MSMLPVMNSKHNIREISKQMILLEDHLFQRSKRCHDCIRKHISTIEAFAEEAITLDTEGRWTDMCDNIAENMRRIGDYLLHHGLGDKLEDGAALAVANHLRSIRKPLLKESFDLLHEIKWEKQASAACGHRVQRVVTRYLTKP
jgi:hypothetical protein